MAVVIAQLSHIFVKIIEKVKFSTFCKVLKPRPDLGWGLGLVRLCYHASLICSRITKVSLCFLWLFATSKKKFFSTILEKCIRKMNFLIYQDCKERSTGGCIGAKLRATTRKIIDHVSNFQGKPSSQEI